MRLIEFFDHGAGLGASRTCLVEDDLRLNYAETSAFTHRIAWALTDAGLAPQSPIALLSPNNLWGYLSMLGLQRGRHIWVPLNARSSVRDNIRHMVKTGCQWLFIHSEFIDDLPLIRAEVATLKGIVCVDSDAFGIPGIQGWMDDARSDPFPTSPGDDQDVFRIAASGGTTGAPKAIVHTHVNTEANMAAFLSVMRYDDPPRFLLCSPMTHGPGSATFHILTLGGEIHFMRIPELGRLADIMERERITAVPLVPTSLYGLLDMADIRERDFSSLRYLMFGGAPASVERLRQAMDVFGPVLFHLFSQTECSTLVCCMTPKDYQQIDADPSIAHRMHSCGKPTPFATLGVMDEQGHLLGDDERGELVVQSNMVMRGYLDDPQGTREASRFGWHHTGDIAYRDADGFYYLVDRIRDVIITGGFNVFPTEVEQVVSTHSAVFDCVVVGVPDEKWGEQVTALIQCKPGQSVDADEIIAYCKARLGSVKAPKRVDFCEVLPRNALGKILRREIRDRYREPSAAA